MVILFVRLGKFNGEGSGDVQRGPERDFSLRVRVRAKVREPA
jgi:hypothetical protein